MLYHKDKRIPKSARVVPATPVALSYSGHAQAAAREDRYGDLTNLLPEVLDFSSPDCQLIEVETDLAGKPVKRVVRIPATRTLDLVLAVGADGFVRTVWANKKNDQHRSLKAWMYD